MAEIGANTLLPVDQQADQEKIPALLAYRLFQQQHTPPPKKFNIFDRAY